MSNTAVHIELPAEALHGSNCEDIDPPAHVRTQVPGLHVPGAPVPWYEKFLERHFSKPDFVFVKINGQYHEASPTERKIIWAIETLVCSPVILTALLFRGGDRVLRRVYILQPLCACRTTTPLERTLLALEFAAMEHGTIHIERSGQILVGRDRRATGPRLETKFLPQIKRRLSEYGSNVLEDGSNVSTTEASQVGAGNWHVCFINDEGDAFTLKAQRMYSDY